MLCLRVGETLETVSPSGTDLVIGRAAETVCPSDGGGGADSTDVQTRHQRASHCLYVPEAFTFSPLCAPVLEPNLVTTIDRRLATIDRRLSTID